MSPLFPSRVTSFCAFCKSPRRIYRRKHVGLTNVLGLFALALVASQTAWDGPDPRALGLFALGLVIAETFIYLRWRAVLRCRMCGFDPLVYKASPARAALEVRAFYDAAGADPRFHLSKSPLVEVHRRHRASERRRRDVEAVRRRRANIDAGSTSGLVIASEPNENTRHHSDLQRA